MGSARKVGRGSCDGNGYDGSNGGMNFTLTCTHKYTCTVHTYVHTHTHTYKLMHTHTYMHAQTK